MAAVAEWAVGRVQIQAATSYENFVLDFVCLEKKLVVEVDGGQHLDSAKDAEKDRALMLAGFHVLRFWNNQVLSETDAVVT